MARDAHGLLLALLILINRIQRSVLGVIPALESILLEFLPDDIRHVSTDKHITFIVGVNAKGDGEAILGAVRPNEGVSSALALKVLREVIIKSISAHISVDRTDTIINAKIAGHLLLLRLELLKLEITKHPVSVLVSIHVRRVHVLLAERAIFFDGLLLIFGHDLEVVHIVFSPDLLASSR